MQFPKYRLKTSKTVAQLFAVASRQLHKSISVRYPPFVSKLKGITLKGIAAGNREWWIFGKTTDEPTVSELLVEALDGFEKDSLETRDGKALEDVVGAILDFATTTIKAPKGCDFVFVVTLSGEDHLIVLEMKSSHNWANSTSRLKTNENLLMLADSLSVKYGMPAIPVIGVCSAQPMDQKDSSLDTIKEEKSGYLGRQVWNIFGKKFWAVVGHPDLYDMLFPVLGNLKERWNPMFKEALQLKHLELFSQVENLTVVEFVKHYKPTEMTAPLEESLHEAYDVVVYPPGYQRPVKQTAIPT